MASLFETANVPVCRLGTRRSVERVARKLQRRTWYFPGNALAVSAWQYLTRLPVSEYTQAVACSEYVESAVILCMHSRGARSLCVGSHHDTEKSHIQILEITKSVLV